ncbi:MAG: YfhO family protein, partial [Patescibacteria group bacterium]
ENRANLLRMMNVKYIISAFSLDEQILKKVFETKITRFNIPIYIYENKNVLPRFYFAKSVKPIEHDEIKALEKMLAPGIDFKNFAFIECDNDCGQNSGGKIIDYDYKDGYLWLNIESQTGGWFIFSESFDRNWQAKINGSAVSIYRTNYVYQSVKVPAGKNVLEFKYQP